MNKVVLTKEQAKSMDELIETWGTDVDEKYRNKTLIREKTENLWFSSEYQSAKTIPDEDFIAALHYGYEVENTPEEKLREYWEGLNELHDGGARFPDDYGIIMTGVQETLRILGIKIEGVNA